MSPKQPSDSGSDSDAPEAVSLSSSKKASEAHTKAIREHERNQWAKRKNENRERDRLLKEEKAKRVKAVTEVNGRVKNIRGKGKQQDNKAIARMERAMREAIDEDDDGNSEEEGDDGDSEEEVDDDSGEEDEDRDEMEEDNNEEEEWAGLGVGEDVDVSDARALQLPDHIFAAAAAAVIADNNSSKEPLRSDNITKPSKKKRKSNKAKDLIIGNRAIKTLSSSERDMTIAGRFQPPPEANKFVERQLQLYNRDVTVETTPSLAKRGGVTGKQKSSKNDRRARGGNAKSMRSKAWNRIPVNLGSLRSGGPAKNFVRGATSSLTSKA
ncbi:hypothetical protein Clacol_006169 [Clathrus columnatus]|uniref:Uncharacterized protein n=1 Tax=Clathrus columnatus TaxID=1419009 RepID=A0AAV5AHH0_9AGAM|nr:hypothetical protein Clacol_006169 [Clathrus columnatus]